MKQGLAILAVVFLAYATTLNHPFFFDDEHYIVLNRALQTPANLLNLWTSPSYLSISPDNWGYRPLTAFLHSVAWIVGQGATWPFHVQKILLHWLVCLGLFLAWSRIFAYPGYFPQDPPRLRLKALGRDRTWTLDPSGAAFLVALIFAVHPANTQVLNYISATSTLAAGTLYIWAYVLYLRYRETWRMKYVGWSLLLYALAVLAKEEGITLVAIVFLTELLLPRRGSPNRLKALGGYVVVAGLMFLLLKLMFAASSDIARGNLSRWSYFMTQWRAWIHYLSLLVWPWDLNADNLQFGFSHALWDAKVISALFANALLLGGAWLLRKRHPIFLFSLLWFYIALSPASSVVVLGEPVNDHRMYLAYFGLVGAVVPWLLKGLVAVGGAELSPNTPPMTGWVTLAALAALFAGTQVRNQVWSSREALWGDTVAKNPRSGRALNNLSLAYFPKQEWDRALEILRRCEWVDPTYPQCKLNLGIVHVHLGRDVEAEDKFRQAIQLDPLRTDGRSFYASFLERRDRLDEALALYQRIDTMAEGTDLNAKLGLARLHRRQGRAAEAERLLLEARARFGDLPQIAAMTAEGAAR